MNGRGIHSEPPRLLLSRRGFLIASGFGLVGLPAFFQMRFPWHSAREQFFLTSRNDDAGKNYIAAVDIQGQMRFEIPVGARCHGVTVDPQRPHRAVIFPRRPGYLAYAVDFKLGQVTDTFHCGEGRYFYGHGCFSGDGSLLFATENDYEKERGVIAVRDGKTLQLIGEFPSFGVGPHEVTPSVDGKTLVVANGGILERPETGREKLNVSSMDPSLAYVDIASGSLLGEFRTGNHFLGMRHLSVSPDGTVAVAIQNEGPVDVATPLLAIHRPGEDLRLLHAPESVLRSMNHFGLSVCMDPQTSIVGLTCPKGNVVVFWDAKSGEYLRTLNIVDASGITLSHDAGSFLITSGTGQMTLLPIHGFKTNTPKIIKVEGSKWDNHISKPIAI